MKKSNLILRSAVSLALGLSAGTALATATSTLTSTATTFATEGIPATGAVTLSAGTVYSTATSLTAANTGLISFTLPTGATFVTTPVATATNLTTATLTVAGGGAGSNVVTFNVNTTTNATATVTLGVFQITGATALASAGGTVRLTAQVSGLATTADNDATARTATIATSATQQNITAVAANAVIDVPSPSNGTRFTGAAPTVGTVGTLAVDTNALQNATNTAAFAFTSTTATVNVSGSFSGITSAYFGPGATTCAATAPTGSTTGTVTATTITFAGVTPGTAVRGVCLLATGTSVLSQTSPAVTATVTRDTFTSPAFNLGSVLYNGAVVFVDFVVGGTSGGYQNFLRVVNRSGAAAAVNVSLQEDAGTVRTGSLGNVAANTATLFTVANINTATGSNLQAATDRASLIVLSPTLNLRASNLMFNPNGTVVIMP